MYIFNLPMSGLWWGIGAGSLVVRGNTSFTRVRALSSVAQRIAEGDLSARTGLTLGKRTRSAHQGF